MNIKECYELFDGDYDEIMHLLLSEERVVKYLVKFKEDKSMPNLTKAIQEKRYKDAFLHAHTLKGISMNLMMKRLASSSSELTEALRQNITSVDELYNQVEKDYQTTIEAIDSLLIVG